MHNMLPDFKNNWENDDIEGIKLIMMVGVIYQRIGVGSLVSVVISDRSFLSCLW